ncbi:hypothetical protein PSHT_12808 [Puccinia striiformis]|uniref:Uncharacterized protein n=1 Tax=Puccinia striiformis TaxID=27350 RepID=A0A2S4UUI8_9BASI|nr:hypothetical protein PSHT_12808 [Puccinia striiformis]
MGPSTTPTTSPPSVPPRTTGEEELIANDKPREEEPLFDHKTLATLKTINRTIKAVDDQAKYDVLVGINLSELLDSDQTNPILDSATSAETNIYSSAELVVFRETNVYSSSELVIHTVILEVSPAPHVSYPVSFDVPLRV